SNARAIRSAELRPGLDACREQRLQRDAHHKSTNANPMHKGASMNDPNAGRNDSEGTISRLSSHTVASTIGAMSFELRHLRYFQAVAEELSFSRAARRLNVAQPALSRAVQQLEESLGAVLLERTRHRVRLTPAGA